MDNNDLGRAPSGQALSASPTEPVPVSALSGNDPSRERPSRHGLILGEALADLAKAGGIGCDLLDYMCATCAFRPNCMTSMMASTGKEALDCLVMDDGVFGCHHGMKDVEPTKACAGWLAAKAAPRSLLLSAVQTVAARLDAASGPDTIRERFDAWIASVDPESRLDDYERGRLWLMAHRDSDGSGEADETRSGSAVGDSADPKGIAQ